MYEKIKSSNYTLMDYGAYIEVLQTRLLVYSTNLSACNEFIKELTPALENSFNKFSECQDELTALEINFNLTKNKYQESIENYEKKLEELSKNIEEKSRALMKELGMSGKEFIHPCRFAVTGRSVSPGFFETISLLGKKKAVERLRNASEILVGQV